MSPADAVMLEHLAVHLRSVALDVSELEVPEGCSLTSAALNDAVRALEDAARQATAEVRAAARGEG